MNEIAAISEVGRETTGHSSNATGLVNYSVGHTSNSTELTGHHTGPSPNPTGLSSNKPYETEMQHNILISKKETEVTLVKKKRKKKLKKTDGKNVVLVTESTQTDWDWKDETDCPAGASLLPVSEADGLSAISSRSSVVKSNAEKSESRQSLPLSHNEFETKSELKTYTDLTPFYLVPDDEFGIPIVELSSESESSEEESHRSPQLSRRYLPSVGPPLILRYIRESDVQASQEAENYQDLDRPDKTLNVGSSHDKTLISNNIPEPSDIKLDRVPEVISPTGALLSGPCEFCGNNIKPFPSLDQQLSEPPESLYCCQEYRDFVELATTTAAQLEQQASQVSQYINVQVHAHRGSWQEREQARERAAQRMHEREIQKREREAAGIHNTLKYDSQEVQSDLEEAPDISADAEPLLAASVISVKEPVEEEVKPVKAKSLKKVTVKDLKREQIHSRANLSGDEEKTSKTKADHQRELTPGNSFSEKGHLRRPKGQGQGHSDVNTHVRHLAPGIGVIKEHGAPIYSVGSLNIEVARQMKTINYQLSSRRCLEEGWTLRAPSPMESESSEPDMFVSEPLQPDMIATGKLSGRSLIERFYPDGSKFLTIFPDGTGNVFYPSGRVCLLISSAVLGQLTYILQDDSDHPVLLGLFEPNGSGCCYFANGKVRLIYDRAGGLELDYSGGRRRAWSWKDPEVHVHAPPFQPIIFTLNSFLSIRVTAQESITLTMNSKRRSCRFNVGVKLPSPESNLSQIHDKNHILVNEHRVNVELILNKISNLLKFPKSPKLDQILPPLHVSAQRARVNRIKPGGQSVSPGLQPHGTSRQIKLPHMGLPALSTG